MFPRNRSNKFLESNIVGIDRTSIFVVMSKTTVDKKGTMSITVLYWNWAKFCNSCALQLEKME